VWCWFLVLVCVLVVVGLFEKVIIALAKKVEG
jgi:hypothetical protein